MDDEGGDNREYLLPRIEDDDSGWPKKSRDRSKTGAITPADQFGLLPGGQFALVRFNGTFNKDLFVDLSRTARAILRNVHEMIVQDYGRCLTDQTTHEAAG
jgi:hypothetical protein